MKNDFVRKALIEGLIFAISMFLSFVICISLNVVPNVTFAIVIYLILTVSYDVLRKKVGN